MDLYALLDEIQTIARNGLLFATNPYDQARYTRLLELATQTYGELLAVPDEAVRARLLHEMGYITPKVGADAAIFNDDGHILLMERADGSGWCLPCGWVEPNEKPAEAAVRETREETGLEVVVKRLVGVFTRMPSQWNGVHTMISVLHLCEVVGGDLTLSSATTAAAEGLALRYWPIDEVEHWHATHEQSARAAHRVWAAEQWLPAISD
jgi:ADP-ribose pyrophosphatase YjhB (NUDIX family)